MKWAGVILLLLTAPFVQASGYHDATADALKDFATLSPVEKFNAVYFWLGDVPEDDRPGFIKAFAGHVNSLSRDPAASFPQVVAKKDLSILRVDGSRYDWFRGTVKQLTDANPYGVVQVKLTFPWHGGVWPGDGVHYAAKAFDHDIVLPFVPARWFVWQTGIQADRKPGYYDFLGLTKRDDFDKLIGFNRKVFEDARRSEYLEAAAKSGVAKQPRRVGIFPAIEGRKYVTFDSALAIKGKNPLRVLNDDFKHDAEELIGFLPNGFLVWFLCTDKGVRQDSAPDFIGGDKTSLSNDSRIHINKSCLGCHYRKEFGGHHGVVEFKPHFRELFAKSPLLSPDYFALEDVRKKYTRAFSKAIEVDRSLHAEAVLQATGLEADLWAKQVTSIFDVYDAGATAREAALFLGCSEKTVVRMLERYAKSTGQLDLVLGLFVSGKAIPRDQYHEVYPELYRIFLARNKDEDAKDVRIDEGVRLPDGEFRDARHDAVVRPVASGRTMRHGSPSAILPIARIRVRDELLSTASIRHSAVYSWVRTDDESRIAGGVGRDATTAEGSQQFAASDGKPDASDGAARRQRPVERTATRQCIADQLCIVSHGGQFAWQGEFVYYVQRLGHSELVARAIRKDHRTGIGRNNAPQRREEDEPGGGGQVGDIACAEVRRRKGTGGEGQGITCT